LRNVIPTDEFTEENPVVRVTDSSGLSIIFRIQL